MKICFFSNSLIHHQLPFCLEMNRLDGVELTFVETEPLPEERKKLGYATLGERHDFVLRAYEDPDRVSAALSACDAVIFGYAPEQWFRRAVREGKTVFRCSERLFKVRDFDVLRWLKYMPRNFPYRHRPVYYLLNGSYAASDFRRCGARADRLFRWGYFTEVREYEDLPGMLSRKTPASILWCARFLALKHPEAAIRVAERLKKDGYAFSLEMIGIGEKEPEIRAMIAEKGLTDCVTLSGSMSPEQVRDRMEGSEIFLFTSDRNEGWGAVLNEAMNSGCAVVSDRAVGAVSFLIREGENGASYGDRERLYEIVKELLDDREKRLSMGKRAYETIRDEWSPAVAAQRFTELLRAIRTGEDTPYRSGPCSRAE